MLFNCILLQHTMITNFAFSNIMLQYAFSLHIGTAQNEKQIFVNFFFIHLIQS